MKNWYRSPVHDGEEWHGQEEKNADCERRYGRIVRYKGGSSTTVTNSYTPSEGEKQLSQASADYAKRVAPNAYYLNDLGRSLLQDSLGAVQVDFNSLNQQAQQQAANATKGMSGLIGSNNAATATANGTLGNLAGQMGQLTGQNIGRLGTLGDLYKSGAVGANSALGAAGQKMGDMTAQNAARLGTLAGVYQGGTAAANGTLANASNMTGALALQNAGRMGSLAGLYQSGAANANNVLGGAGNTVGQAATAANGTLSSLANGVLPSAYQANMEKSISSAIQNTMGKSLANLGNRGVLSSSVTTGAMNDIQKNAANEVARQYQANIGQVAGLAQQQNANAAQAANTLANYAQQQNANTNALANSLGGLYSNQYGLLQGALNQQANLAQQQLANTNALAGNIGNLYNTQYSQGMNTLGQQANLAQQQNANTAALAGNLGNLYNTQYTQGMGALGQQANLAQQQLANTQGNNSQNGGLYGNLANMAGSRIALAAAAQEAAQNPAFRAWNASMGLGSATTNALAGIAGKGASTQTTNQSGGGGFLGGLLGGVVGGAGQAIGAGLFCFPPGTKVKMADGTKKSIEHIEVGEKVMSYVDGEEKEAEVVNVMERHYADVYNIQCQLAHTMATLTQPFLMEDGTYKTLGEMRIGDVLYGVGSVYALAFGGERPVHDIEVSGTNTYFADGFLAKGGDCATWNGGK